MCKTVWVLLRMRRISDKITSMKQYKKTQDNVPGQETGERNDRGNSIRK